MPTETDPNPTPRSRRFKLVRLARLGWPIRTALLVVPLLLILGVAFGFRAAWRSGTADASCTSCHTPSQTERNRSVHKTLPCVTCHAVSAGEAVRLSLSQTLGTAPPSNHAPQRRARCRSCHFESASDKLYVAGTIGHKAHVLQGPKLNCESCHTAKEHSVAPREVSCDKCH